MNKLLTNDVLKLSLILVVSLFLPVTLWGQQEPLYSVVGQCFSRNTTPPGFPEPATWDWSYKADVTLEAGGEIIETKTDDRGRFAFPEINSRQVRVIIQQPTGQRPVVYAGTVELMPGENIVLFQFVGNMQYTQPAITVEGDKWIYRIVSEPPRLPILYTEWTVEKLKSLPGAEYNRRKETITFSGNTLRRTKVDGVIGKGSVYVFGLNPEASE
jgi:hypothetical protein